MGGSGVSHRVKRQPSSGRGRQGAGLPCFQLAWLASHRVRSWGQRVSCIRATKAAPCCCVGGRAGGQQPCCKCTCTFRCIAWPLCTRSQVAAAGLLGARCYVNWPYLQEARVVRVSDRTAQVSLDAQGNTQVGGGCVPGWAGARAGGGKHCACAWRVAKGPMLIAERGCAGPVGGCGARSHEHVHGARCQLAVWRPFVATAYAAGSRLPMLTPLPLPWPPGAQVGAPRGQPLGGGQLAAGGGPAHQAGH